MSTIKDDRNTVLVQPQKAGYRGVLEFILELIKVVAICAGIIILIRWLFFQPFYVKGSSMEPNFEEGEYLIIYQLPYRFPERFSVYQEKDRGIPIIFHPPNDPQQFYIKRLIGLPGERVIIKENKVKIINSTNPDGFYLDEPYLSTGEQTLPGSYDDVWLSLDQVYVLGDNRTRSLDSRRIGPIPIDHVIGKPILRGWPINRAGRVN